MLAILDANRDLLRDDEKKTLELFRQHIDDLEAFHVAEIKENGSRFPGEITKILED
ncbi:hypothetical protein D3C72_2425820 [compost metagenome]